MSRNKINITLPPGRIVMGSPSNKQTEYKGVAKDKPNWFFAVAISKSDPYIGQILQQIMNFAWQGYAAYPQVQQQMQQGLASERFAWKIEDGDAPGNSTREGWAGCFIFKCSTTLGAPPCFDMNNLPMDPAVIKTGHYASVYVSIVLNEQTDHTAGIHINPDGVIFAGYGPEIRTGPSAEQMFGPAGSRGLAPGASAHPVAPSGGPAPGVQPQQQQQAPGFAAGGYAPPPQGGFNAAPQYQPAPGQVAPGQAPQVGAGSAGQQPYPGTAYPGSPTPAPHAAAPGQMHPAPQTAAYPSSQPYPGGQQFQPNHNFGHGTS